MPNDAVKIPPAENPSTSVVTRRRRRTPAASESDEPVADVGAEPVAADPEPTVFVAPESVPETAPVLAERVIPVQAPLKKRGRGPVARLLSPDEAAHKVAAEMDTDMAELMAGGGGMAELKSGDRVRGAVLAILTDRLLVDVRGSEDGWVPIRELLGDDGNLLVGIGDEIEVQIVSMDGEGIKLSWGAVRAQMVSEELESAARDDLPVRGTVVGYNKGGLEVKIHGRRAFCPASQVDRDFSEDMSTHVGKTYTFLITRYDPTGRRTVVSRRSALERESKAQASETRAHLEPGAIVEGTVRKLMDFGAFVDIGGIDGLVHVSEISWERIEKPSDVLTEGQTVLVQILKIDDGRDRIALSIRGAQGDPWAEVDGAFVVGGSYTGRVTRMTEFGAFVELAPGLEGLVHVSEIDWKRIRRPDDVLKVGQEATVRVLEIDPRRRRVALSIRQATEDPWSTAVEQFVPGSEIEVVVESVAEFGVFCTIADGITGLIPNSMTNTMRGANLKRVFKIGSTIKVFVSEVDRRQRKISLSRNEGSEGGASDYKAYQQQQRKTEEKGSMSALALALRGALDK